MTDKQWDFYFAGLKGTIGPVMESNPQLGYYRHFKGDAIAIFTHGDQLWFLKGNEPIDDPVERGKLWLGCAKSPVTKKVYDERIKDGHWPQDAPPIKASNDAPVAEQAPAAEAAQPGPGHNAGELDTFRKMREEILGDVSEAKAYYAKNKITDKSAADRATDWAGRLSKAAKRADAERKLEKQPLLDAIKELDTRWNSVIDAAKTQSEIVDDLAQAWGRAETERLRKIAEEEAAKKWQEDQEKLQAERERMAAERARLAAMNPATPPEPVEELPLAPPPPMPVVAAPKVMLGSGANANRRSVKADPDTATIVDLVAAAKYFADNDSPDLRDLIQKLANRAIKSRVAIPGIRFSWQSVKTTEAAE